MKNWVGIARGQAKRHLHLDLAKNIFLLNERVKPDLVLVDGLVGMEGNGPGDGEPFRLGRLVMSDSAFLNDLVVARLVDMPWEKVGYLRHAFRAGWFDVALVSAIRVAVPVVHTIRQAPVRSPLAVWSERKELHWLKLAVRPLVDKPAVAEAAYRMKITQDVYSMHDDQVVAVRRNQTDCGDCRKCEDFCPTELTADEIGIKTAPEDCIGCLYCWWVCPKGALELDGPLGFMERQVERYKQTIEGL
jgi:ferredoxin